MTTAAAEFISRINVAWDSHSPWADTARLGLSDVDQDALSTICDSTDDDYADSESEVLEYVRRKASR
jgi:hypothetical protein